MINALACNGDLTVSIECPDCGVEFYPAESEHEFICSDCANNPYL